MAIAPAPLLLSPTPAAQTLGNRPTNANANSNTVSGATGFAAAMAREVKGRSPQPGADAHTAPTSAPTSAATPAATVANERADTRAEGPADPPPAGASTGWPARSATRPTAAKPQTNGNHRPNVPAQSGPAATAQTEAALDDSMPTKRGVRARVRAEVSDDPAAAPPASGALLANPLPVDAAVMAQLNLAQAATPALASSADAAQTTLATPAVSDAPSLAAAGTGLDGTGPGLNAPCDSPRADNPSDTARPSGKGPAVPAGGPTPANAQATPAAASDIDTGPAASAATATAKDAVPALAATAAPGASTTAISQTNPQAAKALAASSQAAASVPASGGAAPSAEAGRLQANEPRAKSVQAALREADKSMRGLRPSTAELSDDAAPELLPPAAQADAAALPGPGPAAGLGLSVPPASAAPASAGQSARPLGDDGRDAPAVSAPNAAPATPFIAPATRGASAAGSAAAATNPAIEGAAVTGPRRPAGALRGVADGAAASSDPSAPAGATAAALPPAAAAIDNSAASQLAQAQQLASPAGTNPSRGSAEALSLTHASIDVPIDQPGFAPALGAQISVLARDGVQEARLQLHPAEMGPITVQIAVDGTAARVEFQAEMAATRSAIEASLPALAGALQEAGLTLAGGGVFQQTPQGGQQQPEQSGRGAPTAGARRDARGDASMLDAPAVRLASGRRGLVDLVA